MWRTFRVPAKSAIEAFGEAAADFGAQPLPLQALHGDVAREGVAHVYVTIRHYDIPVVVADVNADNVDEMSHRIGDLPPTPRP